MSKVIVNNKMNEYFGSLALEVAINAVRKCAEKYGFNAEEALEECGLDSIDNHVVFNKTKKTAKKEPANADLQLKLAKPKFPFPYNGEYKETCCQGLKYNRGLFTQCLFIKVAGEQYCKRCSTQAEKNEHSKPDCGSIQDRINVDLMEFRDPKGRPPIPFVKVMRKLKISQQEILEEAGKFNIEIQSIHFLEPPAGKKGRKAATAVNEDEAPSSKKGRPSKKKDIVVSTFTEENDLFATLTQKAAAIEADAEEKQDMDTTSRTFFMHDHDALFGGEEKEEEDEENSNHSQTPPQPQSIISSTTHEENTYSPNGTIILSPEKQFKAAAQEEEVVSPAPKKSAKKAAANKEEPVKKLTKEEKEAEKEAEKAAKLAAKEAEKAAKLEEKKAEKAAKLEAKLEEKKATKLAEKKAAKEAEAAKKKAEEEAAAAAAAKKKAEQEENDEEDEEEDEEDEELTKLEDEEDQADDIASCQLQQFSHAGKKYFKDQFDTIYSMGDGKNVEPAPIGKWNKAKRTIDFNDSKKQGEKDECSDDEEQEEEYEEMTKKHR